MDWLMAYLNERDFLIRPYSDRTDPSERERVYGGTSTHWGGQSRPLEPIVFEKRPGFPGWPINRTDLDPFYKETVSLCHLYGDYGNYGTNFTAEFWAKDFGLPLPGSLPDLNGFNAEMYQFAGANPPGWYRPIVLFGWNPMHRHQNEHDFGFFANALLFFDDFPAVPTYDEMCKREVKAKD